MRVFRLQLFYILLITLGLIAIALFPRLQATGQTTLSGDVSVTGDASVVSALSKGSGSFAIDHPLDPKNKLLYHSFVESPDVKNIYDGTATLDRNGEVTIRLPAYMLALNTDFRYLATALSEPMPGLHLKHDIELHSRVFGLFKSITFTIAGGAPHGEISWQVTGIRHDPYILENPIVTEVEKGPEALMEKEECVFEPLCN